MAALRWWTVIGDELNRLHHARFFCYHPETVEPRSPEEYTQAILDCLRRKMRAKRGTIRRIERALGKRDGYFRWWWSQKDLSLSVLLQALDELEDVRHPAYFFVEALLGEDSEPDEVPTDPPFESSREAEERYEELNED